MLSRLAGLIVLAALVSAISCAGKSASPAGQATSEPAAGIAPSPTSEPTAVPKQALEPNPINRIVFAGIDGGIYTVSPDGTDLKVIANASKELDTQRSVFTWPGWSPDARSIVYSAVVAAADATAQVSLRRASESTPGEDVVVYRDEPGTRGIGSGVPHYYSWSPDGGSIAVIAGSQDGLLTYLVEARSGERLSLLTRGAPMYFAWSANSKHLLMHHDTDLLLYQVDTSTTAAGSERRIGVGSADYFAPDFAPAGDAFAYLETIARVARIVVSSSTDTFSPSVVHEAVGRVAFKWAPDASKLAILDGEDEFGIFHRLIVVSPDGKTSTELSSEPSISFWWSPDSTRLALAEVVESDASALRWSVVDVEAGARRELADVAPSDFFWFMQFFFDQYAHSHQLWSPDGTKLVVFGADVRRAARGVSFNAGRNRQGVSPRVWVLDAEGDSEPVTVGEGYIGAWSPR